MHLLITGGNSRLAHLVASELATEHTIRLFDTSFTADPTSSSIEQLLGDFREPADCARAVAGIDTILHLATLVDLQADAPDAQTVLDNASRGAYVLMNAARDAAVDKVILGSSLALFDRLPHHWQVNEIWRPRPDPSLPQLAPWVAELSLRESARVGTMQVIALRFGLIVDDRTIANSAYDPRWLHEKDAVAGIHAALRYESKRRPDWSIFHITAPGPHAKIRLAHAISAGDGFGYQPTHDFAAQATATPVTAAAQRPWRELLGPAETIPSRPIRKVLLLGAGGPMGVVTTQELRSLYTLRVTDIRPLADIAADAKPQGPGAPLPVAVDAPHEEIQVDVRDGAAVMAATAGVDAIINCTVIRHQQADAFLVNTIGAYHVMNAAVAHKIRRVVHTGPLVQHLEGFGDYSWDYDLPVDAPGRGFDHQYIHSKYLAQEICRVFAEYYDLEVPVLLFCALYNPEVVRSGYSQFTISWADTGRALRRALEVISLPSPYEMVNISADLPHGRFDHRKAHTLLNWQPRDEMAHLWQDGLND